MRKGHLNAYITPKALERFREEVRRLTRRTAGQSLRAVVSRLNRYVRGWGEYFKRAEVAGLFDRYDRWITRRLFRVQGALYELLARSNAIPAAGSVIPRASA